MLSWATLGMHTVGTLAVTYEIKQDSAGGDFVMNLKCYIPLAQTFCVESEQGARMQLHLDPSLAKRQWPICRSLVNFWDVLLYNGREEGVEEAWNMSVE